MDTVLDESVFSLSQNRRGTQHASNVALKSGFLSDVMGKESMKQILKTIPYPVMAFGLLLAVAGCKSSQNQTATTDQSAQDQSAATTAANPQDPNDPANANLAPIPTTYTQAASSGASTAGASSGSSTSGATTGAATASSGASDSGYDYSADYDDASYNPAPDEYADQPPPELPTYEQPPMPAPGYLWTPGYWAYQPTGYYWVPGAWVEPPYEGALWTPGYWSFHGGRYGYIHGYWGRYIGFYGGVNYGHGYVGIGYQGGYWHGNQFAYNRAVNNFGSVHVENVYNRTVVINRTIINNHVSYNGGPRGIDVRPTPAQIAAFRAPHAPPMSAQVDLRRTAATNRAQFAAANHGRPAAFVATHALQADRNIHPAPVIHPPMVREPANRAGEQPRLENRPPQPQQQIHPENRPGNPTAARPGAMPENRPQPNHAQPVRPEEHPQPAHPEQPHPQARPEVHPQPNHAEPARPETRPQPQPHPQEHTRPETHPQQQARPEAHPQPQHPQEARPNPHAEHPAPHERPEPKKPEEHPKF